MTEKEFEDRIIQIDKELINDNVPIPSRPMRAMCLYGIKYNCNVIIGAPEHIKKTSDKYDRVNIGETINNWYKFKYENKLYTDISLGNIGLLISGDVYKLKIPIFFCALVGEEDGKTIKIDRMLEQQLLSMNIFRFVEDITQKIAQDMTTEEKTKAYAIFNHAVELYNYFSRDNIKNELITSAITDYDKSIDYLLGNNKSIGMSMWSSLQAVEKVLKSALSYKKVKYSKTHDLSILFEQLYSIGFPRSDTNLLRQIQCSPSIRYGGEKHSLAEAIKSHHISIFISNRVMRFCI